jgi:hypothetical protein
MKWLVVAFLLVTTCAHAGGRGGSVQTFDPNVFGGAANVSCLTAAIAGVCSTGYNATCDGVADDSAAVNNFRTAAIAANPARVVLYIPPGKICRAVNQNLLWGNTLGVDGIRNLVVWMYGSQFRGYMSLGVESLVQTTAGTAAFQTVSAGSPTITVVTLGEITKFSAGQFVLLSGISLQGEGFPPNFQYFEYRRVTNVNNGTGVITLNAPLTNTYRSTWPGYDVGGAGRLNQGGPAMAYIQPPSWDATVEYFGMTIVLDPDTEVPTGGRNIVFHDLQVYASGPTIRAFSPTMTENLWIYNSGILTGEIDKNMTFASLYNVSITSAAGAIAVQSPSPRNLRLTKFKGSPTGSSANLIAEASSFPLLTIGPNCYGRGSSVVINGSTVTTGGPPGSFGGCFTLMSSLTFSNIGGTGTFSIPNTDSQRQNAQQTLSVPAKYFLAAFSAGFGICNTGTTFNVTAVRQDGAFVGGVINSGNTYYETDLGTSLPSPTCPSGPLSGMAANAIGVYPADTIVQNNSGPASLTQYAAP